MMSEGLFNRVSKLLMRFTGKAPNKQHSCEREENV